MKRSRTRALLKAALIAGAVLAAVLLVLQIALNSRPVEKLVRDTAAQYIDGDLGFSKMHFSFIKRFPTLRLELDSLSLTYPHPRFAEYDSRMPGSALFTAGTGDRADTLARFDSFIATVNVWRLLSGTVRISDASLLGLKVYARSYADSLANWDVFKSAPDTAGTQEADSAPSVLKLPRISIGDVRICDGRVLYSTLTDAYAVCLDTLTLHTPSVNEFALALAARIELVTGSLGYVRLPLSLGAGLCLDCTDSLTRIGLPYLDALVAGVPLSLRGEYDMGPSGSRVSADVAIDSCALRPLVDNYVAGLCPQIAGFVDDGTLTLTASACGPPDSLDVDAALSLALSGSGAVMHLDGKADDVLGKALRLRVSLDGGADLDSLAFLLPDSRMDGRVALSLDADVTGRDLEKMSFGSSSLRGRISSPRLSFGMDSLSARLDAPSVAISAKPSGLSLAVAADTVKADYGPGLKLRLRGMSNEITLTKVERHGSLRPKINLHNSEKSLFVKSGNSKAGLRGLDVSLAATRRGSGRSARRKAILDSLQREYPLVSRDSLIYKLSGGDSFEGKEILTISADSSVTKFLSEWRPEAAISLSRGFVATPSFPLRTRVSAFKGVFDGNVLSLDTLSLTSGTSDLEMSGEIKGLRRLMTGRKGMISADVNVSSRYINANELLAAATVEKDSTLVVSDSESDESFVTDTLRNANVDSLLNRSPLVPANLDLALRLKADSLDYTDLHIKPFRASIAVKDRTLQLKRASMRSNLGDIFLSAFYSARTADDIGVGLDLRLQDISAEGIIHMLPAVDSILPALKSFQGDLNCDLTLTGKVDPYMNLKMPTLDGVLNIGGENLYVADAGDLKKITRLLMFRNKDIGEIKNMTVSGVIHDNRLEVYPFELDVDRYKLALQGVQGFDDRMDYHISVMKSPLLIPFGIRLYGDAGKWKFRLTSAKYRSGHVPAYTETLDTVRVNIRKSIMDIFRVGASRARIQNAHAAKKAAQAAALAPDTALSEKDRASLDAAILTSEIDEQTRAIEAEANAALEKRSFNINSEAFRREMEESRNARKAARNAEREKTRKK